MLGLIAGAIAKTIMPGDDPGGIIVTIIIGIVGAIVGGYIASALGIGDQKEFFDIGTWIIAILGALLLLAIYPGGRRGPRESQTNVAHRLAATRAKRRNRGSDPAPAIRKPLSPGGFRAYQGWSNIRLAPPRGPCDGSPDRAMVRS